MLPSTPVSWQCSRCTAAAACRVASHAATVITTAAACTALEADASVGVSVSGCAAVGATPLPSVESHHTAADTTASTGTPPALEADASLERQCRGNAQVHHRCRLSSRMTRCHRRRHCRACSAALEADASVGVSVSGCAVSRKQRRCRLSSRITTAADSTAAVAAAASSRS